MAAKEFAFCGRPLKEPLGRTGGRRGCFAALAGEWRECQGRGREPGLQRDRSRKMVGFSLFRWDVLTGRRGSVNAQRHANLPNNRAWIDRRVLCGTIPKSIWSTGSNGCLSPPAAVPPHPSCVRHRPREQCRGVAVLECVGMDDAPTRGKITRQQKGSHPHPPGPAHRTGPGGLDG